MRHITAISDYSGLTPLVVDPKILHMNLKIIFSQNKQPTAPAAGDRCLRLCDLRVGETATIHDIETPHEEDRLRMNVLGLALGSQIKLARTAPGGDPAIYHVEGTDVALRREAAVQVIVSRS